MVELIVGKKGKGKTKVLLDKVNGAVKDANGSIVYLDKSTKHMYELNNKVRLIDVSGFPVKNADEFVGFICGILSQDHDPVSYTHLHKSGRTFIRKKFPGRRRVSQYLPEAYGRRGPLCYCASKKWCIPPSWQHFSKITDALLSDIFHHRKMCIRDRAQVCSGGVDTSEVHSKTMESRLHKGLYFAGELLDIDGTCGGYNLQWAWSSGAAAGIWAAKEEEK